jgi:PAS domain S-box-containing protein
VRRRLFVTLVSLAGFAGAFFVLEQGDPPGEPGGALLFAPFVALLAFEWGMTIGAVAGAAAALAYVGAYDLSGGEASVARLVGRLVPLVMLGGAIGWLSARLADRETSYRRIVDNSGEVIWVIDGDGVLTFINPRAKDVLGYEPEEMIGRKPTIQLEAEEVTADRVARRRRGETESYDLELLHKDGHSVWMHVIGTPMFDRNGRFAGGLGMASDITARRRVEAELAARERLLEEAQQLAHIGSWEWEIAANRITWSDELYRIYGVDPGAFEASYEAYLERIHPDDRALAQETVQRARATGEPFAYEHRLVRPDGEVRLIEARGTVSHDEHGRAVRMAGTGHDITERKQAELELANARAELARSDLARRQATELNDTVVQALVLAKYAVDRGDLAAAERAVGAALGQARQMINDLIGEEPVQAGQLRRERAAGVGAEHEPEG